MRVLASVCTKYETEQPHESEGETQQAAGTTAVVLRGEHILAAGHMAEVQMQQLDPALHMKSSLEFRMLNHARSYYNIQNKVDEG